MTQSSPGLTHERDLAAYGPVAGLDEAGRGAWAGPVVAGAVILPVERADLQQALKGVRDSKLCTPLQREHLYPVVLEVALAVAAGVADPGEIDRLGIVGATRLAMHRALVALRIQPSALLIDGQHMRLPASPLPQRCLSFGERHSLSIAAASIIAKVTRDRLMVEAETKYAGYGFAQNKGYGTAQHSLALQAIGPCDFHRRSFAPVHRSLHQWGRI